MKPVVIIGSGIAGYTVAREFRKLNTDKPLQIISAADGRNYSKPMLSNALAKGKSAAELAMANASKMEQDLDATIYCNTTVERIDTVQHAIQTPDSTIEYHKLVLALGASQIAVPLAGDATDAVLSVNSLEEYAHFRDALDGSKRVAILGPGLIGCEFANDLIDAGFPVTVIGPDAAPLGRLLPIECGLALQQAMADQGVQWRLGTTAERVDHDDDGFKITLANGGLVSADLILSAIGLRPNTALASAAGLTTQRGIVVDRTLQTSATDVYALGDCMEINGLVLPYVMPIMFAARALAQTLNGESTRVSFPAMPVVVKTPACPVVVSPPPLDAEGQWQVDAQHDGIRACYYDNEHQLLGFALTGAAIVEKQQLSKELPAVLP